MHEKQTTDVEREGRVEEKQVRGRLDVALAVAMTTGPCRGSKRRYSWCGGYDLWQRVRVRTRCLAAAIPL
jgi:hypothetical protein